MGAMMNLRMAQAWKAIPQLMALGSSLGSKEAAMEIRAAIMGPFMNAKNEVSMLLDQVKTGATTR